MTASAAGPENRPAAAGSEGISINRCRFDNADLCEDSRMRIAQHAA
jgi:hypothetical protein